MMLVGFAIYIGLFLVAPPYFQALMTNLIWNNTSLEKHTFKSDQTFWGISKITITNWLAVVFTLGIFWPWAKVRLARYRAEHTAVLARGDLDGFVGKATAERRAYGEEIADIFDFDFGF